MGGSSAEEPATQNADRPLANADNSATEDPTRQITVESPSRGESWWKAVAIVALGLWLISGLVLIAWLADRRRRNNDAIESERETPGKTWRKQLKKACLENDPLAARKAFHGWARAVGYPLEQLEGPAVVSGNKTLSSEVSGLNAALYAPGGEPSEWTGAALWQAFSELSEKPDNSSTDRPDTLTALYPD